MFASSLSVHATGNIAKAHTEHRHPCRHRAAVYTYLYYMQADVLTQQAILISYSMPRCL